LIWQATLCDMNPNLSAELIADALVDDPEAGASEWLGEFRSDLAALLEAATLQRCIVAGIVERPYDPDRRYGYLGFCDPAGGSGSDSMTMAIAHHEFDGGRIVLDLLREHRPPFNPSVVVAELAATLARYGCSEVHGDRYAGSWPAEQFHNNGIEYQVGELTKSGLYLGLVPLVNSGRVELLDSPRLMVQLDGLERRTA
jgi:hypothetical protein